MKTRAVVAGLASLLVLAVWLRVRGLSFGLPAVYNPDEIAIMSRALAFAKGDPNPHNFLYPTLYFYALFVWEGLYFAAGRLTGSIPSLAAFQQSFFADPTGIFLAGRTLSVVCGAATVLATARMAHEIGGRAVALAAGLFLAVAPFAVRDAHYVKHDVPVTLLIVLGVMVVMPLALGGPASHNRRRVWAAGFLAGLAASTHYYGVFAVLPVVCAVWVAWHETGRAVAIARVAEAAATAALAFVLGSPFLFAEPATALRDIRANRQIVVDRAVAGAHGLFASAPEYLRMIWQDAIGWPVAVLAAAGLVVIWRLRPRVAIVVGIFPAAFLLFISNTVAATRYLNPVLPFLAVLAGVGVVAVGSWAARGSTRALLTLVLTCAAAAPGLAASWHTGSFFRETDTRTIALAYFTAHVPDGEGVLVQPYSVPLPESRESLIEALTVHLGDPNKASTKFHLRLATVDWPKPSYRVIYLGHGGLDADKLYVDYPELGGRAGLSVLRSRGVHYVVLKRYNDESAVLAPLVEALAHEGRRMALVSPFRASADGAVAPFLHNTDARIDPRVTRPGPIIEIWQLP